MESLNINVINTAFPMTIDHSPCLLKITILPLLYVEVGNWKWKQQHVLWEAPNDYILSSKERVKMTADTMCGEGSSLAIQCLAFCQALASQGQAFNFSLKIGSNFSFCLDNRDVNPVTPFVTRKKTSPSAKRRNARRRAQFLNKKQESLSPSSATS